MFDWNGVRYFLAVAHHRSTTAAARALGVDQSTVQRRVAEFERRIGRPLVRRTAAGYRLTEFGERLVPHAQEAAEAMRAFEQHVADAQRDLHGVVRMTCPEPILKRLAQSELLERFAARYPGVQVAFVMSDRYLDLTKGDADLALRSGDTDDGTLVGRKVADSLWAIYGSNDYVARHGRPGTVAELARHAIVVFDERMANHRAGVWLREQVPQAQVVARNDSVLGLLYAVKAGIGLAPLPTAIADAEADLVRVLGPLPELARAWRLLTTAELRRTPRVAALFDFLVEEVDALRPILTG